RSCSLSPCRPRTAMHASGASVLLFELRLRRAGRLLAKRGLVHRLVFAVELWVTLEALRLGAVMDLAPVALVLELRLGVRLRPALAAHFLRDTVLLAPSALVPLLAVALSDLLLGAPVLVPGLPSLVLRPVAACRDKGDGREQRQHQAAEAV